MTNLYNYILSKFKSQGENDVARITTTEDKYALYANGELIGTYARARDAKRGAARRGLVVA